MPAVVVADLKTGLDRTRRHVPSPVLDRVWNLVNAFVNDAGRIVKRPGLTGTDATAACRGLLGFRGKLHTFAATPQTNPSPALLVINVLRHPTGAAATLAKVHSVHLFLGALYVVAEFSDAVVKHYWLQPAATWTANTKVERGEYLQPTAANGFYYEVSNDSTINAWQANTAYAAANQRQPTAYNGFYYQVTSTTGTTPKSGDTEPAWPTVVGATITEVRLVAGQPVTTPTVTPPPPAAPPPVPPAQPGPITGGIYHLDRLDGINTRTYLK